MRKSIFRVAIALTVLLFAAHTGFAAMGEIRNFAFEGMGPDVLGPGESAVPDGNPDAVFSFNIAGVGALTTLALTSPDGQAWDTVAGNGVPGMQVKDGSGRVIVESSGSLPLVPLLLGARFIIAVHDDGSIARGGTFTLTARFADGSQHQARVNVPPSAIEPLPTSVRILSARWTGRSSRDITGPNEQLRGDGNPDHGAQLSLRGQGVLTGVTVRATEGERTEWDTLPGNNIWLVAVLKDGRILNKPDGSIEVPLEGDSVLELLLTDTGALARGQTRFDAVLVFRDGAVLSQSIERESADAPPEQNFAGSAVLTGPGARDLVGRNEQRQGNGKPDWKIDLKVETLGTVNAIKISNIAGSSGEWDTVAGTGNWLIGVTRTDGSILNAADGSVRIPISQPTELHLWIEDNETLDSGQTRSRVTLLYDDGRVLSREIEKSPVTEARPEHGRRPGRPPERPVEAEEKREISFSNPRRASSSDYVGPRERIGRSGTLDWLFEFRIKGKGTVTGIIIEAIGARGRWDTIPGNRHWAVGVLAPGKGLLNNNDSSVSFEVPPNNNLQLFVEDNGILERGATRFKVTVQWSDGTTTSTSN